MRSDSETITMARRPVSSRRELPSLTGWQSSFGSGRTEDLLNEMTLALASVDAILTGQISTTTVESRADELRGDVNFGALMLLRQARYLAESLVPAKSVGAAAPMSADSAGKQILSRDDLSFTKRDSEGRLVNWFVPERNGDWHEHFEIGAGWFDEIVALARHDPEEAYNGMRFAGPALMRYWNHGHPDGFFQRMSQWALAAMMAGLQPVAPCEATSDDKAKSGGSDA